MLTLRNLKWIKPSNNLLFPQESKIGMGRTLYFYQESTPFAVNYSFNSEEDVSIMSLFLEKCPNLRDNISIQKLNIPCQT